jgi:ATP adenylyltransferase/5',5'''-P-1,P-4-tetraphosphate phosphorylase II
MTGDRFLTYDDLKPYGAAADDLAELAHALVRQQTETWAMLQEGASTLDQVEVREIEFPHFTMKVQFNPGRIGSSSAKVDNKSIAERKCFLCLDALPPEQKGIETGDYTVLCNPFPIFREHFTVPHRRHVDQRIPGSFSDLLRITRALGSRYSLFYNGPACGASAPDHLHFQAGEFGFMSIDTQWETLVRHYGQWLIEEAGTRVAAVDDSLRRFIVIESEDAARIEDLFARLFEAFSKFNPDSSDEPMVNVLTAHRDGRWRVIVFLRRRHRPEQFFRKGEDRIVFSPASVDFGGVCITPVEKDFHLMNRELLTDMFGQLSARREVFDEVVGALRSASGH